ncbi:hypothetical protein [Aquabacter sp. L1I39]|nr:hypothetical protein [Aquabacter sp. L1I39]
MRRAWVLSPAQGRELQVPASFLVLDLAVPVRVRASLPQMLAGR